MEKPFDLGFVCGRFQHMHIGHQYIFDESLKLCKRVLVFVGSAQESGTERNPFDVELRMDLIKTVYSKQVKSGQLIVKPLNDLSNEHNLTPSWGKYLLENVRKEMGKNPDIMIYGNDDSRSLWFDKEDIRDIAEFIIPRSKIEISATQLRQYLVEDKFVKWSEYVDPKLWNNFDLLKNILLKMKKTAH